ncbi:uncharacterized protein LOC113201872 isoform X4 [Frankliniella occidentalis]|uniref:Uncharacterized protein LOC113201872 isoform X4 n=1 Tax=Frankliniella occidentalis TaxID=133901 RepID=A0A6J1RYF6_FRAOC|nr:uncharacterized protein LOC113201872 isoform X4 [Frankliniella occidentalis]
MASSFYYVAIKGALASSDCDAFGLDPEEISALTKRFPNSKAVVTNGLSIKGPPLTVINTLCQLGYKVVSSTGEIEITWTLQRETSASEVVL